MNIRIRLTALGMVFVSLMSALAVRLWFLQVLAYTDYANAAEFNQVKLVPIAPTRGRILDRNGVELVRNRPSLTVSVRRDALADRDIIIERLVPVLGLTAAQIADRIDDRNVLPYAAVPVAEEVSEDVVTYIKEHQSEFPGVVTEERTAREYPQGLMAAHLLGYVGEINPDQVKQDRYKGYRLGALVGKAGIEGAYEKDLHGKEGQLKLEVDSTSKVIREKGRSEPELGRDVVTSIDSRIQAVVEASLLLGLTKARTIFDKESQKNYLATAGGAVVMDPINGEIIAMASLPTFDPAMFTGGISRANFDALANDPANPLINRVTQAAFPPGSTFKIVTTAAALEDGIATRGGKYNCPASYRFRDRTFRNWKSTDSGVISVPQALIDSCDTVFYPWGAEFYKRFAAKRGEGLQAYARDFGFGHATGLEIGDKAGRVPDAEWLKTIHKRSPKLFPNTVWLPGYTINMSIGQGDVLATPLQVANSFAVIANGGTLPVPHVGLKLMLDGQDLGPLPSTPPRKVGVAQSNIETIRRGLEGVPTTGTARGAFLGFPFDRVSIAAKTGTAELQTRPPKQPYSWFAAYAPAKDPRYVVVIMLEEGGHGGETAAPIARRVIEALFDLPLSDIVPAARTD
ncbi:MAG: penicillin-binding protein 2 [Actinomycetota bacterium]